MECRRKQDGCWVEVSLATLSCWGYYHILNIGLCISVNSDARTHTHTHIYKTHPCNWDGEEKGEPNSMGTCTKDITARQLTAKRTRGWRRGKLRAVHHNQPTARQVSSALETAGQQTTVQLTPSWHHTHHTLPTGVNVTVHYCVQQHRNQHGYRLCIELVHDGSHSIRRTNSTGKASRVSSTICLHITHCTTLTPFPLAFSTT